MKKIHVDAAATQPQSETFPFHVPRAIVQELRILTATSIQEHPNIIKLFALAWDIGDGISSHKLGAPVLIQEYAEYGNLQDFLVAAESDELLSSTLKASLCCDVAAGLQALHDHSIIHGDVKCENILISRGHGDDRFVAKVSDFGFSVIVRSSNHLVDIPINLQGTTLRYAAPELYIQRESTNVNLRRDEAYKIDIYSYALLVYIVALSGQDIFGVLADLQYKIGKITLKVGEEMVKDFEWNDKIRNAIIQTTIESTKLNARTGRWVRNVLRLIVKERDLAFVDDISPIIENMLVQEPRERCSDFTMVWKSLASGSGAQSRHPSGHAQDSLIEENTQKLVHDIHFQLLLHLTDNCQVEASRGIGQSPGTFLD
jgi:serine/threonine protein kinase